MRSHTFIVLFVFFIMVFGNDDEHLETTPTETNNEEIAYNSPEVFQSDDIFFSEHFDHADLDKRWIKSSARKDGVDESLSKYDGLWNIEEASSKALSGDLGLVLKSPAKHHAISVPLNKEFVFEEKSLVVQYDIKFQEGQDCGGAYIKLLASDNGVKLSDLNDKTGYSIMFGPDRCGNEDKVHFIFRYKHPVTSEYEEKHASMPPADKVKHVFTDKFTHLFTLIVSPDNEFQILIDQEQVHSGSLLKDFKPPVAPPKEIDDPNDKKPEDWDENPKISDPDAVKPDDWDESQPEKIVDEEAVKPTDWLDNEDQYIPDPRAERPDDWDDSLDGEWEAPLIENPICKDGKCGIWQPPMTSNPLYKGKWSAPMIDNPNYKGIWAPRKIANPNYFEDDNPFASLTSINGLSLELWSMSAEIMFDNFIITSSLTEANEWAEKTWAKKKELERRGIPSSDSVIDAIVKSTEDKPWLWIVYAMFIILPVGFIISYCLANRSSKKDSKNREKMAAIERAKKTDEQLSDDPASEVEGDGDVPSASGKDSLETPEEVTLPEEDQKEEVQEEQSSPNTRARKRRSRKD